MRFIIQDLEEVPGEIRAVPFANNIQVAMCSDLQCPHVHLLLCTDDDRPYTMAVLSIEQAEGILEAAKEIQRRKRQ